MKKAFFIFLFFFISNFTYGQKYITSVSSQPYIPPVVSSNGNVASAVKVIMDSFNWFALINCSKNFEGSLTEYVEKARNEYKEKIPIGNVVQIRLLINNATCKVFGYEEIAQVVRVSSGVCSIDDIKLDGTDSWVDPNTTSYFNFQLVIGSIH